MGLKHWTCLLLQLMLLSVTAELVASECTNIDPCLLDCTDCAVGDKVPDPENCRGYYICEAATVDGYYPMPFECSDGQVFNATQHECVVGTECEPCPAPPYEAKCSYECPSAATEETKISSFDDCNIYYICDTAGAITGSETCDAATPFFDGAECQDDETHCCHCHAYCYAEDVAGTLKPDPLDCRRYYLCTEPSTLPTNSGTCPEGENFDSILGTCSATAMCKTTCFNVLGPDGCIDPFTCVSDGFFARCPKKCTPDYYHCTAVTGEYEEMKSCTSGTVFHPDTHTCVSPSQCPYTR